jgi:hypothetical protein
MLPSTEDAFQTIFTWNSAGSPFDSAEISYDGDGKANLTEYTEWLLSRIETPDLAGFSLAFAPLTRNPQASVAIVAARDEENQWTYHLSAQSFRTIAPGSADHTIDILDLLNVGSIDPSPYALTNGIYASRITVVAGSPNLVSYTAHQPSKEVNPPARGWFIDENAPWVALRAVFSFGNDSSSVSLLTFTFSGLIVPEFPSNIAVITFLIITLAAAVLSRRRRSPERLSTS